MRETFAISPGNDSEAMLWCQGSDQNFEVINGRWFGRIEKGLIYGIDRDFLGKGSVVWRGYIPNELIGDYNKVILWIQEQVKQGINYTPALFIEKVEIPF